MYAKYLVRKSRKTWNKRKWWNRCAILFFRTFSISLSTLCMLNIICTGRLERCARCGRGGTGGSGGRGARYIYFLKHLVYHSKIEGTTAKLYAYVLEYGTTLETVVFTLHQNKHARIVIHLHGIKKKPPVALCRPALPSNAPFARQISVSSTNPTEIRALFWLSMLIATLQNGCKRQRAPL